MQLSAIVPFHRDLAKLRECLAGIRVAAERLPSSGLLRETIVVADGCPEDPLPVAAAHGARVVAIEGPRGPATARNRGVAVASGDVLVFVDSDVIIGVSSLARIVSRFVEDPELTAVFGAYDEHPTDPGFISQGKNLAHCFIHQRSAGEARTFWAGLGAVRADVFASVGGFDERFTRPSVEDIDLGYRISAANGRIVLDPAIQGRHLKQWTLRSALMIEIRDRGIPWTQLLHRYGGFHEDLNLTRSYRACVVAAYAAVGCIVCAVRWPLLLVPAALSIATLWFLDRSYYRFFSARKGPGYAIAWFPIHVLHHLSNGLSFALGTLLHFARRWTGVRFAGTLPETAWMRLDGRTSRLTRDQSA
jgi:GT2 family glycosyltransferase